jgi:hypothetical protein
MMRLFPASASTKFPFHTGQTVPPAYTGCRWLTAAVAITTVQTGLPQNKIRRLPGFLRELIPDQDPAIARIGYKQLARMVKHSVTPMQSISGCV